MAHDSDTNTKPGASDPDVSERVRSLREKTSELDNTLNEIEQHLDEAREGVKE